MTPTSRRRSSESIRALFAAGSNSGIFSGCIGSVDGVLVKIICPEDGVKNADEFFSRNGYTDLRTNTIMRGKFDKAQ